MKNPTMLYKAPGPHEIHGGRFDYTIVDADDADAMDKAKKDGWSLTTTEAVEAKEAAGKKDSEAKAKKEAKEAAKAKAEADAKALEEAAAAALAGAQQPSQE